MKRIILLFGEMGAGKNYFGEQVAMIEDCSFFDGDTVATPQMIKKVIQFKPLNRELIVEFIEVLKREIVARIELSKDTLVVAQALYFDEDRKSIISFLESQGYRVSPVWVKVSLWRNFRQILSRPRGWRWVLYWLMNKPFFQKPTHSYRPLPTF